MAVDDPITLSARIEPVDDGVRLELVEPTADGRGSSTTRVTFADADDAIYAAGMALVYRLRGEAPRW